MNDEKLTQNESRFVVEWLRRERKLKVGYKLAFWNLRPTAVVDQVKRDWKVEVTPQEIVSAARREQ
jgi:hypothetical protein